MHETGQDHPARPVIRAKLLGSLEQMFELRHVRVRIAVVHEPVQILGRLPNPHLHALQTEELLAFGLNEIIGLTAVIEPVEFADRRSRRRFIISEFLLLLVRIGRLEWARGVLWRGRFRITFLEKVLPLVEIFERRI